MSLTPFTTARRLQIELRLHPFDFIFRHSSLGFRALPYIPAKLQELQPRVLIFVEKTERGGVGGGVRGVWNKKPLLDAAIKGGLVCQKVSLLFLLSLAGRGWWEPLPPAVSPAASPARSRLLFLESGAEPAPDPAETSLCPEPLLL